MPLIIETDLIHWNHRLLGLVFAG